VTVARPRDPARLGSVALPPAGALDLAEAIELARLEGRGDDARDAIVLSVRACMLLRSGLGVRAFVMDALMHMDRSLTLGARAIVLEFGVYR
jgi:hypothetical protein